MADRRRPGPRASFRILMGVGLDSDGHARVTKGEDYLLLGGSDETHSEMQERVEKFRGVLADMGTDLQEASREQVREAADESGLGGDRKKK